LILDIIPSEEAIVDPNRIIFVSGLFREVKELLEVVNESSEQEITVYLPFDVGWKLLKKFNVCFTGDSLIFVVDPSIVKVFFNLKL
jgi:hypothetical protein